MAEQTSFKSNGAVSDGYARTWLITLSVGLVAAIVFGLIWIFIISPTLPTGNLGWFLFSFATGLTMIVLPCTLPLAFVIVPLAMGRGMVKGLGMALSFGTGVALMLSLYGVIAAAVGGAAVGALGAPLESVKNWVYFIAGIFALIFALSEIGLLKVRMPTYSGAAPAFIQKRGHFLKAFLLGMFLGNIGVGCPHPATPLLLIEIASSGDILYGWLLFLVHAIGRVLPLLLLAFLGILGVNGLNWLVARKDKVEKVTGWAMVFVAGFILTLGLFTHDWWVNSGIHTQFEKLTQEERFIGILVEQLDSEVIHSHGIEEGLGLFGLPLWFGNWFLVSVWVIPMWWWWLRKRRRLLGSPSFRLRKLEEEIDLLEKRRREIEGVIKLDDVAADTDLAALEAEADALEKQRREAEETVQFAEQGVLKSPVARDYEFTALTLWRNFFLTLTILLGLVFIYALPHNFLFHEALEKDAHDDDHASVSGPAFDAETFSNSTTSLPPAVPTEIVHLRDGDTYDITATIVAKEVGNRTLKMLAYNGSVPGPIITVDQGAEITIRFTNKTDIETTIHHHGVRLDNRFDGVPNVTQDAIAIGETFSYTVRFPDAGVYWYHPHIREDYAQDLGLYGNYIVEPLDGDYWSPVNREVPLIVDDMLIEEGSIDYYYKDFINFALIGRFGNTFLVNGEEEFVVNIKRSEVIRFPVTNVSSARTYKLSIPGVEMKRVGADVGKYEREIYIDDFLISPAERVIIEAYFDKSGLYRLRHTMPDGTKDIAFFNVSDEKVSQSYADAFNVLRRNADVIEEIDQFRPHFNKTPDKRLRLTIDLGGAVVDHDAHAHDDTGAAAEATAGDTHVHDDSHAHGDTTEVAHDHRTMTMTDDHEAMMMGGGEDTIQWDDVTQSDRTNTAPPIVWKIIDRDAGAENMNIDWTFRVGDIVKVSIFNDTNAEHVMQHPIHFHGQRFLILSRNGVPEVNKVWKDTVLVLPGETLEVLIEMSNSGEWMAHCHIAEHLHAGMMMSFRVLDMNEGVVGDTYREGLAAKGETSHLHPFWRSGLERMMESTGMMMPEMEEHAHDDSHPHDDDDAHLHEPEFVGPWFTDTAWWVKLIVSLVLMALLSLGVRRYLKTTQ